MKKLKIFLGDLSYINKENRFNLFVPLNIGYIASYSKKCFGEQVEIILFKDPNKLLAAIESEKPDVLGLSFSYWNTKLNHVVSRKAKEILDNNLMVHPIRPSDYCLKFLLLFEKLRGLA